MPYLPCNADPNSWLAQRRAAVSMCFDHMSWWLDCEGCCALMRLCCQIKQHSFSTPDIRQQGPCTDARRFHNLVAVDESPRIPACQDLRHNGDRHTYCVCQGSVACGRTLFCATSLCQEDSRPTFPSHHMTRPALTSRVRSVPCAWL